MAENSAIEWCRYTWNPWVGCTRLSPACAHCYAESWAKRTGQAHLWEGERRRTTPGNWQQPFKWDRAAAAAGERHRVFCASLADFFDNQVPTRWRDDAWHRIRQTPNLDWMLLTKRPQNIAKMLPTVEIGAPAWDEGWDNVWLGTTVEDRERLRNVDQLRQVSARVRFLSVEPLLEDLGEIDLTGIHLVIVGGENGPRPMHPEWVRSIRDQCAAVGVPFFFKQWGTHIPNYEHPSIVGRAREVIKDPNGSSMLLAGMGGQRPAIVLSRVGKKAAGRLLDGRTHDGMPEVRHG